MELSSLIDHTVLKPDATKNDIEQACLEAVKHRMCAVCVAPYYANFAVNALAEMPVKVATVIGFPMGYSPTVSKVEEIKRALSEGVDEVDVVVNISAVKSGDWTHVQNDIDSMTRAVHLKGKTVKVILETALMTQEELKKLCEICTEVGVDYVKTSTGFNAAGASVEHVAFLRANLPKTIKIKASGGIRTADFAKELIAAGANRLGCSASVKLLEEA